MKYIETELDNINRKTDQLLVNLSAIEKNLASITASFAKLKEDLHQKLLQEIRCSKKREAQHEKSGHTEANYTAFGEVCAYETILKWLEGYQP